MRSLFTSLMASSHHYDCISCGLYSRRLGRRGLAKIQRPYYVLLNSYHRAQNLCCHIRRGLYYRVVLSVLTCLSLLIFLCKLGSLLFVQLMRRVEERLKVWKLSKVLVGVILFLIVMIVLTLFSFIWLMCGKVERLFGWEKANG